VTAVVREENPPIPGGIMMTSLFTAFFPARPLGDAEPPRWYTGRHRHPDTWRLNKRERPLR